jgi:NAD(P)H-dependent flavin oxidoreductase YrpB (nitropropane dioxygenase family)
VCATVGTGAAARAALGAGVDGLVVQGSEAGGHLVGVEPVAAALPKVLDVAGEVPVLAAGGVADANDVTRLLDAGAAAAVAGTRFLLTEESDAHPGYKQRVADADRTIATLLFGVGWPLPHRVVPNAVTRRWCAEDELGPRWVRRANERLAVAGRLVPMEALGRLTMLQRVALPLYTPGLPLAGMPDRVLDHAALYAGETVHRLHDVLPAADALARLVPVRGGSSPGHAVSAEQ